MTGAICSIIFYILLELWLLETAPTNPVLGATHAIKWQRTIIYLTDAQQLQTDLLFWGGPVLLLIAVGVNLLSKSFSK